LQTHKKIQFYRHFVDNFRNTSREKKSLSGLWFIVLVLNKNRYYDTILLDFSAVSSSAIAHQIQKALNGFFARMKLREVDARRK
jgi:hypothetical protein